MRKDVRRRHDAHVRTSAICSEHQAMFDATQGGQKTREALGTHVADTEQLLALQQQSLEERRAAIDQLRTGRSALQKAVKAVVTVGRLVRLSDTVMGTLRQPGAVSDDELIACARGLLARVTPHADAFVAEGLPPDLLTNLGVEVQRFGAAKDAQVVARQRFAAAAGSIRESQDQADTTIAALVAIADNTPAAHPEVMTKLRNARRVGPRPAGPAAKPAPPPTPPTPTPADKAA